VTTFLDQWRGKARSLKTFGDSITQALHIADPADRWSNRLATALGASLDNHGLSGTVMQHSPDASGAPRANNGRDRYERDLLAGPRADVIAILYGSNDARYTAAPATLNRGGFVRDYRDVLAGLLAAGYAPDAIVIGSPPRLPDAGFGVGADDGFAGQSRDEFARYTGTIRDLAAGTGTYYAPVSEEMGEDDSLILPDHVHPNPAGHARIASIFASATRL
jgi:lysophospholipase L1-like esterase